MKNEMLKYFTEDVLATSRLYKERLNQVYGCNQLRNYYFKIKKVIFNDPATIVIWADGTKTVVKCQEGDMFDKEKGLAMAISKRALGDKGRYCEEFKKWIPEIEDVGESNKSTIPYSDAVSAFKALESALKPFNR
jgi:hypothetical protein